MKTVICKTGKALLSFMLILVAIVTGASSGVMMAEASVLPDAGVVSTGADGTGGTGGIATETQGREDGDPEFYSKQIDERIIKIRPMSTPVDQISRHAKAGKSNSFEVKYYSIGTRPIECKTNAAVGKNASVASVSLPVDDVNMFTLDDTIRVVGVKALYQENGSAYDSEGDNVPDLVLHVCGVHETSNLPVVYAVNGDWDAKTKQATIVPDIPEGTTLVRMGKACGELDVQTGRFNNLPTAEIQYCQNFMIQIEQSTFDKLATKEVDWNFSDLEEDAIFDMRLAMENTFLFGDKRVVKHKSKDNMATWFTGGIWWMAGKDIEVGSYDAEKKTVTITDNDLVDITKELFVGTGVNKRKVLFCGSEMLAAFSKIESDKFRLKDTVEVWNLKFKSWDTDFGEVLTIHHELFDKNGMSDCGFAMDPEYLTKRTHISWARHMLDLKKAGVRNTDAVVLQEVSCLYLRYAKAHARMKLAKAPAVTEP
ncbi:MAG: hypothetical protein NC212_08445 [Staphylococcus sp.]|nr:hypothetical protein [Staphylococcus sp.]